MFFKEAYKKSISAKSNDREISKLENFLSFTEPIELNLGYTAHSNKGKGLKSKFAKVLVGFFLENTASRIIDNDELYPDKFFNPAVIQLVTENFGPDGISDLSAGLIMDYLIYYTQKQCEIWKIDIKELPVRNRFNFDDMEWLNGEYALLPENPLRRGEPVIFVPKRFLRTDNGLASDDIKRKILGILAQDPNLKEKFSNLLLKNIKEIEIEEIRGIILQDQSIITKYLELREKEDNSPYDFNFDYFGFLYIKKFADYFKGLKINKDINSCGDLLNHANKLIEEFEKEFSKRDGWKEMWVPGKSGRQKPNKEVTFGRFFRAMGHAYFNKLPQITFDSEVGTGNGFLDFRIIYKECRIAIELKLLCNATNAGKPPIKAYLHGIERQLPEYTVLTEAIYSFYITGQHWNETVGKKPRNHSSRIKEIEERIPNSEAKIREEFPQFVKLFYKNIDLTPRASASKL